MHPNPAYRLDDRALHEALLDEVGFGMVFAPTPDGPRVVHTPIISTGDGAVQFHIARGNALAKHLAGETALITVNGPDGYVSPRWYLDRPTVPTWNFVAIEIEGRVRRMEQDGLIAMLDNLSARHEARIEGGKNWTREKLDPDLFRRMLGAIVGFEMEIQAWRPTFKLGQDDSAADRASIAEGLEASGSPAIAQLMRTLAP
ncbi:FMN-binding negative transcriptional regulator [Altererythrobacter sp. ZODW24]|uniref:FMN-binding negative transcriptional regulator n=1 Tax=Altererythrobacter sp. ZODW24 TaxID=2185142 RepID=UPI000DF7B738|nr:FMN-binding negative transcriptional regulator [Altererythrobacter sp. ZODW24]